MIQMSYDERLSQRGGQGAWPTNRNVVSDFSGKF